jgi:hypothetical protein
MKSSPNLSILGALLLLAPGATEATPITWTDTINFTPNVYISQWNAGLNPAADVVANFSLNLDPLGSSGPDSLVLVAPEGDVRSQRAGTLEVTIVSLLDKDKDKDKGKDKDKDHKPATVPEPGILSLIGLGLLAVALVTRGTRRMRAAVSTMAAAASAATTHSQG